MEAVNAWVDAGVLGLSHAVAWLDFRALAARAGLGIDVVHVLLQILNAWSVVLVASAALRAGARLTAGCAAVAMLWWISTSRGWAPFYNSAPGPLLLATVVLLQAPRRLSASSVVECVTRLALVAAVLANVHAGCVVAGAGRGWRSRSSPGRP